MTYIFAFQKLAGKREALGSGQAVNPVDIRARRTRRAFMKDPLPGPDPDGRIPIAIFINRNPARDAGPACGFYSAKNTSRLGSGTMPQQPFYYIEHWVDVIRAIMLNSRGDLIVQTMYIFSPMHSELEIQPLRLGDVKILRTRVRTDSRGTFSEVYSHRTFSDAGLPFVFVQDNQSVSRAVGTIRGLHYQTSPWAQHKLIRVLRGRIYDVAVDLRRSSPTFKQWVSFELSAEDGQQILIPAGFAHGFCTLEPDTQVFYKVSNFYAPSHDFGIRWDDPELAIDWPVGPEKAVVSDKDSTLPFASQVEHWF